MPEHALELQNLLERIGCLNDSYREASILRHGEMYYLINDNILSELGTYVRAKSTLWEHLRNLQEQPVSDLLVDA